MHTKLSQVLYYIDLIEIDMFRHGRIKISALAGGNICIAVNGRELVFLL